MTKNELITQLLNSGNATVADYVRFGRLPGKAYATPQQVLEHCEDAHLNTAASLLRKYVEGKEFWEKLPYSGPAYPPGASGLGSAHKLDPNA